MKFSSLSQYLLKLENTSSRIEITKILAELFKLSQPEEIDKIVYLVLGKLAPTYKSIVFNLADKLVLQAIAKAYEKKLEEVKKIYKQKGDLGNTAESLSKNSTSTDSVEKVYEMLMDIAKVGGEGSVESKIDGLASILQNADTLSARFIARIPVGKLRLGFSDKTIIDALSWMENNDKSGSKALVRAYEVLPDIGLLSSVVRTKGVQKAATSIGPVLGVPVMPMLASRIKSAQEMIEKMGEVTVEPKYDGLRVLIHYKKCKWVKAFTRNLNDISQMFPELEKLSLAVNAQELILDSEAVGLDETTKKLADFQTTMQRRRKHDIEGSALKIPLIFNIFDVLYVDGKNLMDEAYLNRRKILQKIVSETKIFKITPFVVTSDPKIIEGEYKKHINQGLEGIMVKKANTAYVPGRTGYRWVKMKETEKAMGKLSDTLDCVVLGFSSGQGKRTAFGVGQFLAAVRDGDTYKSVTKVGTGLTDEQFRELKTRLTKIITKEKPKEYDVHKDLFPDFWVSPKVVVELAADDITVSPKHTVGYALRFPRLVNFRDDKSPEQATTVKEVKNLYKLQKK